MKQENTLLFIGSKERFKRSIAKQDGKLLDNCRFTLVWRSTYFRRGLTFRIRGIYEKAEAGYLLHYRFLPTAATILWILIPMLLFLGFGAAFFLEGDTDAGFSVSLFSLLYPAVALWQARSCHKQFRKLFEIATR